MDGVYFALVAMWMLAIAPGCLIWLCAGIVGLFRPVKWLRIRTRRISKWVFLV